MTAAHDYEDLHHLVDLLTPVQATAVRAVVLQLVQPRDEESHEWPPSWFGSIHADRDDIAARSEDILRDEFGRRS